MSDRRATYVLDASVGVKWFKREAGSDAARALSDRSIAGEIRLVAPTHFVHEVLSVVQRELGNSAIVEGWEHLQDSGITIVPLTDDVIRGAARQCDLLGCSFYDSLAPACASLLDATLASADTRAHGGYPGVEIV
ncbi:MAG: type II toxin-antitoxin system VapC family toxin [Coriobacteriia bacterium]